jgi:hypothetical protein
MNQPQSAHDEAVLAVAMRGLIQVHEIHVNGRPGDVLVELRVQVADRFVELLRSLTGRRQSRQPCRRRNTGLSRLPLSAGSLPLR